MRQDEGTAVGVALAGGLGRRIGGDKATVELHGRPLLDFALQALLAELPLVAVVAKPDTTLPQLDPRVAVWLEDDALRHPLVGVVRALRGAAGRPVVVLAGDMPFVTPALVRALATGDAGGAPALVARSPAGMQPLCARYEPQALASLEGFDPDAPVRDVVAALAPAWHDVADERLVRNVNSPEDLLLATAELAAGRGG